MFLVKDITYHGVIALRIMGNNANIISDELVKSIVEAPKYISRKVDFSDLQSSKKKCCLEKNVKLDCDLYDCRITVRQSIDNPFNFSVILIYKDSNKNDRTILRLNGNHGRHRNRLEKITIQGPHIHYMTERYQERTTHPDGYAVETQKYDDLGGAIDLLMEVANIGYYDEKIDDGKGGCA